MCGLVAGICCWWMQHTNESNNPRLCTANGNEIVDQKSVTQKSVTCSKIACLIQDFVPSQDDVVSTISTGKCLNATILHSVHSEISVRPGDVSGDCIIEQSDDQSGNRVSVRNGRCGGKCRIDTTTSNIGKNRNIGGPYHTNNWVGVPSSISAELGCQEAQIMNGGGSIHVTSKGIDGNCSILDNSVKTSTQFLLQDKQPAQIVIDSGDVGGDCLVNTARTSSIVLKGGRCKGVCKISGIRGHIHTSDSCGSALIEHHDQTSLGTTSASPTLLELMHSKTSAPKADKPEVWGIEIDGVDIDGVAVKKDCVVNVSTNSEEDGAEDGAIGQPMIKVLEGDVGGICECVYDVNSQVNSPFASLQVRNGQCLGGIGTVAGCDFYVHGLNITARWLKNSVKNKQWVYEKSAKKLTYYNNVAVTTRRKEWVTLGASITIASDIFFTDSSVDKLSVVSSGVHKTKVTVQGSVHGALEVKGRTWAWVGENVLGMCSVSSSAVDVLGHETHLNVRASCEGGCWVQGNNASLKVADCGKVGTKLIVRDGGELTLRVRVVALQQGKSSRTYPNVFPLPCNIIVLGETSKLKFDLADGDNRLVVSEKCEVLKIVVGEGVSLDLGRAPFYAGAILKELVIEVQAKGQLINLQLGSSWEDPAQIENLRVNAESEAVVKLRGFLQGSLTFRGEGSLMFGDEHEADRDSYKGVENSPVDLTQINSAYLLKNMENGILKGNITLFAAPGSSVWFSNLKAINVKLHINNGFPGGMVPTPKRATAVKGVASAVSRFMAGCKDSERLYYSRSCLGSAVSNNATQLVRIKNGEFSENFEILQDTSTAENGGVAPSSGLSPFHPFICFESVEIQGALKIRSTGQQCGSEPVVVHEGVQTSSGAGWIGKIMVDSVGTSKILGNIRTAAVYAENPHSKLLAQVDEVITKDCLQWLANIAKNRKNDDDYNEHCVDQNAAMVRFKKIGAESGLHVKRHVYGDVQIDSSGLTGGSVVSVSVGGFVSGRCANHNIMAELVVGLWMEFSSGAFQALGGFSLDALFDSQSYCGRKCRLSNKATIGNMDALFGRQAYCGRGCRASSGAEITTRECYGY